MKPGSLILSCSCSNQYWQTSQQNDHQSTDTCKFILTFWTIILWFHDWSRKGLTNKSTFYIGVCALSKKVFWQSAKEKEHTLLDKENKTIFPHCHMLMSPYNNGQREQDTIFPHCHMLMSPRTMDILQNLVEFHIHEKTVWMHCHSFGNGLI